MLQFKWLVLSRIFVLGVANDYFSNKLTATLDTMNHLCNQTDQYLKQSRDRHAETRLTSLTTQGPAMTRLLHYLHIRDRNIEIDI